MIASPAASFLESPLLNWGGTGALFFYFKYRKGSPSAEVLCRESHCWRGGWDRSCCWFLLEWDEAVRRVRAKLGARGSRNPCRGRHWALLNAFLKKQQKVG